jgi:mycofactocin precursor
MSDIVVESDGLDSRVQPFDAPDGGVLVEEELLVEEISIDGMCGVY